MSLSGYTLEGKQWVQLLQMLGKGKLCLSWNTMGCARGCYLPCAKHWDRQKEAPALQSADRWLCPLQQLWAKPEEFCICNYQCPGTGCCSLWQCQQRQWWYWTPARSLAFCKDTYTRRQTLLPPLLLAFANLKAFVYLDGASQVQLTISSYTGVPRIREK